MCDLRHGLLLCHNLFTCKTQSLFLREIKHANVWGNGVKTGKTK